MEDNIFSRASDAMDAGDHKLAYELFSQSAADGDASSQHMIGFFHDEGIHVPSDKEVALTWYKKAYENGEIVSATNIALVLIEIGQPDKAILWLNKAIQKGDGDALYELAKCYEKGIGTRENTKKAIENYQKAIASSNVTDLTVEEAQERLKKLQSNKAL